MKQKVFLALTSDTRLWDRDKVIVLINEQCIVHDNIKDIKDEAEEDGSCGNHKEEYLHLSLCLCDILFRQYSHNPEGWRSPVVADKHLCRNRGVFGLYLSYNCNGQRFRFAFSFGYRLNGKGKA